MSCLYNTELTKYPKYKKETRFYTSLVLSLCHINELMVFSFWDDENLFGFGLFYSFLLHHFVQHDTKNTVAWEFIANINACVTCFLFHCSWIDFWYDFYGIYTGAIIDACVPMLTISIIVETIKQNTHLIYLLFFPCVCVCVNTGNDRKEIRLEI